jgi:protein tyrosine/serine phosphatase
VNDKLWRGAQPQGAAVFRRLGVKTVINLRHDHDDLPDLAGTEIAYVNIPMRGARPREAEIVLFLAELRRAMADPKRTPVLVHCEHGKDRTGYAIAAYRIVEEGWDADTAIQEMFDFRFNTLYFGNPAFLRRLAEHRAEIRARVARVP